MQCAQCAIQIFKIHSSEFVFDTRQWCQVNINVYSICMHAYTVFITYVQTYINITWPKINFCIFEHTLCVHVFNRCFISWYVCFFKHTYLYSFEIWYYIINAHMKFAAKLWTQLCVEIGNLLFNWPLLWFNVWCVFNIIIQCIYKV